MTKEELLDMCKLLDYGITVNENNKHWYDEAIKKGYVEVRKPKRATKFFLTDRGIEAIQPAMYLHIYRTYYFVRDAELTEDSYERYHEKYPDLNGWDLLIQYHKDKISEYDGNRTQTPPRTFIYFIAKLYSFSGRPEEAIKYFILVCILDLSGVMQFPTSGAMHNIEDSFVPGGRFYRSKEKIKEKATLAPGIVSDLKENIKEAGYTATDLRSTFNEVMLSISLPYTVYQPEEMIEIIENDVNKG